MTIVVNERSPADRTEASQGNQSKPKASLAGSIAQVRANFSSRKGASQSFLSLADQAAASITNFLTGVIIARSSSKEEFGLYMLGFTLILLATDLQTSLIATPYMVYSPRLKGDAESAYAGSSLVHQVAFSFLIMVALAAGAVATGFGIGPRGLQPVLWALATVAAFIMLREFTRRICFARLKLQSVFALDTLIGIAQISGLLILAHFRLVSAANAYWLIGAVCALGVAVWLWSDRKFYNVRLNEALKDLRKNWSFAKWVFASGLLATASTNLYPWLIAFFHGTAAAGVFAACMGVVSASNPILLGIQNLLGPKIAHAYAAEGPHALRKMVLKLTAFLALPIGLLTGVLILWGDRFIGLLYGKRYSGNGTVVAVLALNIFVLAVAFAFSRALFAIERADLDFWFNVGTIVMMATLGLWLVKNHGPLGAALGMLIANIVVSTIRAVVFLRLPLRVPLAAGVV